MRISRCLARLRAAGVLSILCAAAPATAQPLEPLRARLAERVAAWQACPREPVVKATPARSDLRKVVDGASLCLSTVKRDPKQTEADVAKRKAAFAKACALVPEQARALAARPDPCATRPARWTSTGDGAAILNYFRAIALHVTTGPASEAVDTALAGMQASQDFARGGGPLIDHMIAVAGYDLVHAAITHRVAGLSKAQLAALEAGLDRLLALEPAYGEMLASEADSIAAFHLAPSIVGPKWLPGDARRRVKRTEGAAPLGMLRLWARLDAWAMHVAATCKAGVSAGTCELALHDAARRFGTTSPGDPLSSSGARFSKYVRKLATRRAALAGLRAQVRVARGGACPPADLSVPGVDGPLRLERGAKGGLIEVPATLGDIRGPIAEIPCNPKGR